MREDLQKLCNRKYIGWKEYQAICAKHEISLVNDQMALSGYLHDLGIILHFRNDTALADTVFLDPQWLTKAMYTVLADNGLREMNGVFSKSWFSDLLGNEYDLGEKSNVLRLMQKSEFDLCYRLESGAEECYLVPHLRPDIAPEKANKWDRTGCLTFRYVYAFMPVGVISRLSVRLNQWIEKDTAEHYLVWKSGAIFARNDSRALVREEVYQDNRRMIDISICGPRFDCKELLGIIRGEIELLHQLYNNIQVEQYVPCNCALCRQHPEPMLFEATRLLNHVKAGERTIKCEKLDPGKGFKDFRPVFIEELISGIIEHGANDRENEMQSNSDPLNEVCRELRNITGGLKDTSDSIKEAAAVMKKKSGFAKLTELLTPIRLTFAIVAAILIIAAAIKTCQKPFSSPVGTAPIVATPKVPKAMANDSVSSASDSQKVDPGRQTETLLPKQ